MKWIPGRRSDNLEDRRGQRATRGIGGGLGKFGLGTTLILIVLSVVFKQDFLGLLSGGAEGTAVGAVEDAGPVDASPEEERTVRFVSFVLDDAQATWGRLFRERRAQYEDARLVLFRDATQTACGFGESATGPFYCPGDHRVYVDLGFFQELSGRFGASGDFAQAYVLAHELGHHVQAITGVNDRVRELQRADPRDANALSVRQELQADCYAGIWAHSTAQRDILDKGDVDEGLGAAAAVGDDRLQRMGGGRVNPDAFTHGSSTDRMKWFQRGFTNGRIEACDTFADLR